MSTFGALSLLCGFTVIWPAICFFIGLQIGRRRLRSPIIIQNPLRTAIRENTRR
jgi:hypothetical protein